MNLNEMKKRTFKFCDYELKRVETDPSWTQVLYQYKEDNVCVKLYLSPKNIVTSDPDEYQAHDEYSASLEAPYITCPRPFMCFSTHSKFRTGQEALDSLYSEYFEIRKSLDDVVPVWIKSNKSNRHK